MRKNAGSVVVPNYVAKICLRSWRRENHWGECPIRFVVCLRLPASVALDEEKCLYGIWYCPGEIEVKGLERRGAFCRDERHSNISIARIGRECDKRV